MCSRFPNAISGFDPFQTYDRLSRCCAASLVAAIRCICRIQGPANLSFPLELGHYVGRERGTRDGPDRQTLTVRTLSALSQLVSLTVCFGSFDGPNLKTPKHVVRRASVISPQTTRFRLHAG